MIGGIAASNNYTIPVNNIGRVTPINTANDVESSSKIQQGECKTCSERMYVDGSNEGDVSFKAPGHISPSQSYGKVMSHEQEHVANAREKASKPGARLISATVSLKYASCPECGKRYVAGGTTNTMIEYSKDNPYDQGRKTIEGSILAGQNIDKAV